jgi:hypothetical protein
MCRYRYAFNEIRMVEEEEEADCISLKVQTVERRSAVMIKVFNRVFIPTSCSSLCNELPWLEVTGFWSLISKEPLFS